MRQRPHTCHQKRQKLREDSSMRCPLSSPKVHFRSGGQCSHYLVPFCNDHDRKEHHTPHHDTRNMLGTLMKVVSYSVNVQPVKSGHPAPPLRLFFGKSSQHGPFKFISAVNALEQNRPCPFQQSILTWYPSKFGTGLQTESILKLS